MAWKRRPFLMSVHPLWLRARLYYKYYLKHAHRYPELFLDARLYFAPDIRMNLLSTDVSHGMIALAGFYELTLTRRIATLARAGGTLIDVGANYGYYTCLWGSANMRNRVLAIEASPRNIEPLRVNIQKNSLESRVLFREVAAGKEDCFLPFTLGPENQSGWGGLVRQSDETTTQVPCVTLDRALSDVEWDRIDVLKIDTEGADTWVLYGAEGLLKAKRIRHIFFEQHPGRMAGLGIDPTEAAKWLNGLGYRLERLKGIEWHAVPRQS
jgi:FkbM family methyltransferase